MNSELVAIINWILANKLSLTNDKKVCLLFSDKKKTVTTTNQLFKSTGLYVGKMTINSLAWLQMTTSHGNLTPNMFIAKLLN